MVSGYGIVLPYMCKHYGKSGDHYYLYRYGNERCGMQQYSCCNSNSKSAANHTWRSTGYSMFRFGDNTHRNGRSELYLVAGYRVIVYRVYQYDCITNGNNGLYCYWYGCKWLQKQRHGKNHSLFVTDNTCRSRCKYMRVVKYHAHTYGRRQLCLGNRYGA